jgi:hypothetical protein
MYKWLELLHSLILSAPVLHFETFPDKWKYSEQEIQNGARPFTCFIYEYIIRIRNCLVFKLALKRSFY